MSAEFTYTDLEIRISERQAQGYPVDITLNREAEFPRSYLAPEIVPWLGGISPQEDGQKLFAALFGTESGQRTWAEICGRASARRIRLRIDDTAPELHTIPWELICETATDGPPADLAASSATPFSRYLAGRTQHGAPTLMRPIRILVAIGNPQGLEAYGLQAIEIDEEVEALKTATAGSDVTLHVLPQPCTLAAIEQELRQGYHALHLICHGQYRADPDPHKPGLATILLANEENQIMRVAADEFAQMIARQLAAPEVPDQARLRLIFLASCQTATQSPADAFRGFGPKLIQAGLPAVVAMQDLVPTETARNFASIFYHQLLEHGYVDLACNEARAHVIAARLRGASIPVLFMRLAAGMLFGSYGTVFSDQLDSFWTTLLDNIKDGECTPILGPGVTSDLLPSPVELAQHLAAKYDYPFRATKSLPRVAQFVATIDKSRLRKEIVNVMIDGFQRRLELPVLAEQPAKLSDAIAATEWGTLAWEMHEREVHSLLADLKLPLYVTTNFDNFMSQALTQNGTPARQVTIDWRARTQLQAGLSHFDIEPPPTPAEPVVLHLFGTDADLSSLVLTEDDFLDYLARISRDFQYRMPANVNALLTSNTLIFLGFRLDDLDLKVILRGILTNLDMARWGRLHVAVQLEAEEVDQAKQEEVARFFQRYFASSKIDVYWGSAQQFVAELHARWRERSYD